MKTVPVNPLPLEVQERMTALFRGVIAMQSVNAECASKLHALYTAAQSLRTVYEHPQAGLPTRNTALLVAITRTLDAIDVRLWDFHLFLKNDAPVRAAMQLVFEEALRRVKQGWAQHCGALDIHGEPMHPCNLDAKRWSLEGALASAIHSEPIRKLENPLVQTTIRSRVHAAILDLLPGYAFLTVFNDAEYTTQAQVIEVLEHALVRLAVLDHAAPVP